MLRQQLHDALKAALLAKEQRAVSTLRLILATLKDRDIAERGKGNPNGLGGNEILGLLQSMIKQRRESIQLYEQGGRSDLARQEAEEIAVIERFLPQQMDDREVGAAIDEVIEEVGARNLKDMGRIMAALRERYAGQMDFGKASAAVKSRLH